MARFRRMQVLSKAEEIGIVPVFYHEDVETVINIVKACNEGGAYCIEFTNRGDHAIDVFKEVEKYCRKFLPDLILGIGSIIEPASAALYINHGANFVVSPCIDEATAEICNKRKIPYMPGCASVSEIHKAHGLGVEICKLFPGLEAGGPGLVKNIMGPCPWASIMPTGGVEPTYDSLSTWFSAGIRCAGMGSKLIRSDLINAGKFDEMAQGIKDAVSLVRKIRAEK